MFDNNTITFNGIHYIQTEGTAIGSHLGMNYASSYMWSWEKKFLRRSSRHPKEYFRFVDDVWAYGPMVLRPSKNSSMWKTRYIVHPRILELRYATDKINFLDVLTIRDASLITDLFTKPTDKHLYLRRDSSHPESIQRKLSHTV